MLQIPSKKDRGVDYEDGMCLQLRLLFSSLTKHSLVKACFLIKQHKHAVDWMVNLIFG